MNFCIPLHMKSHRLLSLILLGLLLLAGANLPVWAQRPYPSHLRTVQVFYKKYGAKQSFTVQKSALSNRKAHKSSDALRYRRVKAGKPLPSRSSELSFLKAIARHGGKGGPYRLQANDRRELSRMASRLGGRAGKRFGTADKQSVARNAAHFSQPQYTPKQKKAQRFRRTHAEDRASFKGRSSAPGYTRDKKEREIWERPTTRSTNRPAGNPQP